MNIKNRNINLDIIRILAVISVMMIHTSATFLLDHDASSAEFMWGNFFDSISRIGVPLFIMISGALLLDENKELTFRRLINKNIKSTVYLILFWSTLYCVITKIIIPIANKQTLDFPTIIVSLARGHYHMWYLYMLIGLYLATPFLRKFVCKENQQLVLTFICISIATQFFIPLLNGASLIVEEVSNLTTLINSFHAGFFNEYVTYFLLGWYIVHIGIKRKKLVYGLGVASVILNILYVHITKDFANAYSEMNVLVLLYSVAVFVALNNIKATPSARMQKGILLFSNLCFGVYIIHPFFQLFINKIFVYHSNPALYMLCYLVILAVMSFMSCWVLSKIPGLKKTIRM